MFFIKFFSIFLVPVTNPFFVWIRIRIKIRSGSESGTKFQILDPDPYQRKPLRIRNTGTGTYSPYSGRTGRAVAPCPRSRLSPGRSCPVGGGQRSPGWWPAAPAGPARSGSSGHCTRAAGTRRSAHQPSRQGTIPDTVKLTYFKKILSVPSMLLISTPSSNFVTHLLNF